MVFESGCVAELDLTVRDARDGAILEQGALAILHGGALPFPALSRLLTGLPAGSKFAFDVAAADAFGAQPPQKAMEVPRKVLGRDVVAKTWISVDLPAGPIVLWVDRVEGRRAWIRPDHPLTGRDVRVEGEVVFVRFATVEEVEHAHAHGPGGAHS